MPPKDKKDLSHESLSSAKSLRHAVQPDEPPLGGLKELPDRLPELALRNIPELLLWNGHPE